jgi:hemerythrin
VNRLISTTGTISTHSETITGILQDLIEYARTHFKTEERLMTEYGYPGLEEQKRLHAKFRRKTSSLTKAVARGDEQIPEVLLEYLL